MRFGELQRMHDGIPAKTLSKELKDLEQNGLVKRTVLDTMPVTVTYEITPYGRTLEKVLHELLQWGVDHRAYIRTGNVPKKVAKRVARTGKLEVVG
jgi:DNA-binding HxlR family transcriptional regulator